LRLLWWFESLSFRLFLDPTTVQPSSSFAAGVVASLAPSSLRKSAKVAPSPTPSGASSSSPRFRFDMVSSCGLARVLVVRGIVVQSVEKLFRAQARVSRYCLAQKAYISTVHGSHVKKLHNLRPTDSVESFIGLGLDSRTYSMRLCLAYTLHTNVIIHSFLLPYMKQFSRTAHLVPSHSHCFSGST
jgi:hypothetical protein